MNKLKSAVSVLRRYFFFYILWPFAFCLGCFRRVNPKLILFAFSKNYNSLPDNMTSLYNELKARGCDCLIMQEPKSSLGRVLFDIKFQLYYARCGCAFVTDNFDPLYAHKSRKGTEVVQLWHACGAFKKWGYSTLDLAWGGSRKDMLRFPKHNTYTLVSVSSNDIIPCYAEAFGCDKSIIKPLGTPRTDIFFNNDFINSARDKIIKEFPSIGKRKIILYAPTFRGNSPDKAYNDRALDFAKLNKHLGEEYALVLKLHPFTARKFRLTDDEKKKYGDFVFDASGIIETDVALCAADLLIADYSSLIFEYALLDKPMLFYAYDLEEYDRDRSFYYDYKNFVPGKIVYNNDEIITAIQNGDFESEKVEEFKNKFMSACDGNSTKRIADYIMRGITK